MSSTPGPSAPSTPSMEPARPAQDSREYTKLVYHVETPPLQLAPLYHLGMHPVNLPEFTRFYFCLNMVRRG